MESETSSHIVVTVEDKQGDYASETLDAVLVRKQLPFPDFIKLDVQGVELMVLSGATAALEHAEFCLLEETVLDLFKKRCYWKYFRLWTNIIFRHRILLNLCVARMMLLYTRSICFL